MHRSIARGKLTPTAEETDWIVGKKLSQPFTYQFMNEATQSNSSDLLFCHFYFSPSVMGNTVVFQFKNEPAAKIATWEGPMAPSSVSKTVTSALSTSTVSVKSTPAGTSTSSASSNPSSGGGLSTGASAGIGVGAAVAVLAILAAVFFFWRSRKLKRQQNDAWIRPPPSAEISYKSAAQTHAYSSPTTITTFGGEMEGSPTPVELKGSSSEYELRGNAPGHELDNSDSKRGW